MDKQIGFKELEKQVRFSNGVMAKRVENENFKVNDVLIFSKPDHSKLMVSANRILDFQDDFFDSCFTANTIYFWQDPIPHFLEIIRVLRPGGKFNLAFIEKNFGEKLPWTQSDFTFYKVNEVKKLFQRAGFLNIEVKQMSEEMISKDGQEVTRPFVMVSGQKNRLNPG